MPAPTIAGAKPLPNSSDEATITWVLTTADPNGDYAVPYGDYADRTLHVFGTFGGATVVLDGSLNGGTNSEILNDPQGNPISKTAAAIEAVLEVVSAIRPRLSVVGAGATITCILYMRKNRP